MSVRFVIGRAGSGKTHRCLEAVRAELRRAPNGPALILLVPEQATFQVERALIETPGLAGFSRGRVVSFRRLAHLLFNECGGPAYRPISGLAKQMALRAVLGGMKDKLPTFAASLDRPGFLSRMAGTFREFHQYEITSGRLRERAQAESEDSLAKKLTELADAFDAFNAYLAEAKFTDPDASLALAANKIPASSLLAGSKAWVDGFAGFTPQELRFLGKLAETAETTEIAIVADPSAGSEPNDGGLFRRTEQTIARLSRMFADKGVRVDPPILLNESPRFARSPRLGRLERELFAGPARAAAKPSAIASTLSAVRDGELVLIEAPNRIAEARAAANQVRHLVSAGGLRYRDIAVILRDLEGYWQLLTEAFGEAGIPYFIDRRESVAHHPLVELLRSAVGSVARPRLAGGPDIVAYLRTGFPAAVIDGPADEIADAIDRIENFAVSRGVAGEAWFQPNDWRIGESFYGDEDGEAVGPANQALDARLRSAARQGLTALAELHESVARARPTGRQWADALWRLLVRLHVRQTLSQWESAERQADSGASIHLDVLDSVESLLGDIAIALSGTEMTPAEFSQVLEAGLSELTVALVPPALDQVLIGQIERSRHPPIKAALVLGMAERVFPRLAAVQSILTAEDRERLADAATPPSRPPVELAPSRRELLFDEDLLAYLALTRPSRKLWLSYPSADEAGKPVNPSRYVWRLRELMPDLPLVRLADEPAMSQAATTGELAGELAGRLASIRADAVPPPERAAFDLLRQADPRLLSRTMASLAYSNEPALAAALAAKLFAGDGRLACSVTRLESFAACPFQHFARFGLRLARRDEPRLDPMRLGRLCHKILCRMFDQLPTGRWCDQPPAELRRTVERLVAECAGELPANARGADRYLLARAGSALGDLVEAMHAASAAGPTVRQVAGELGFGLDDGPGCWSAVTVPLDNGATLVLRGVIDRLDAAGDGAVFVIDYKTGPRNVDWNAMYWGFSLQLPVYLLAVKQNAELIDATTEDASPCHGVVASSRPCFFPAGAFFQPIMAPPRLAISPADADASGLERYRRRGLFLADAAKTLHADLEASESSPFVNLRLKADGSPHGNCRDLLSRAQFDKLLDWTMNKLKELAELILAGKAGVEPYRMGHTGPCTLCEFAGVCRLDFDYNRPRYLERKGRDAIFGLTN